MLRESFEEKQLFKKILQNFFRTANGTFSVGLLKKLSTFLEKTFHGKSSLIKKSCHFRVYAEVFFRIIDTIFLIGCSRLHFSCPEEHVSWKKLFSQKVDSFYKIGYGLKFFESLPEKFRRFSEKCNLRVHRNTLKTNILCFDTNIFSLV